MSALRRLLNPVDRWLDFTSLREPVVTEKRWPGGGVPCLASYALERAASAAFKLDAGARLKRISAPRGTAADGAAQRWTMFFELPRKRAKLLCDWYLDGDKSAGRFGRECLDTRATPYPAPDSELGHALEHGRVAYGRLRKLWREERRRLPDLPLQFRDSDEALTDLCALGLRVDRPFGLRTELSHRGVEWVARMEERSFSCRFFA